MKPSILVILATWLWSCTTANKKQESESVPENITVHDHTVEKLPEQQRSCDCIDYHFSQKDERALLTHTIGNSKIIVCGYRGAYERNLSLGEKMPDSSFYASGFVVFDCSGTELKSLFENSEYYLDRIKPNQGELEIIRLMRMPQDSSLEYKWTEILSIRLFEQNGSIKIDSSFVLSVESYSAEFMEYFKSEIDRVQNDSAEGIKYPDYVLDYTFIQAVKYPKKHSKTLKAIGPFDGYLGPIYRDILEYYSFFEAENSALDK